MSALIAPSDQLHVSESVASIAVVTTAVGLIALRLLAGRSIAAMLTVVAAVTVVTSLAGVGAIAVLMLLTPLGILAAGSAWGGSRRPLTASGRTLRSVGRSATGTARD